MSIHHMLADMFLSEIGLKLGPVGKAGVDVFFEVVPPVKMSDFLEQNPDACGFVVAEPLGTMAINSGVSELMFFSGELWQNHPCCVIAMREDFIEAHPEAVHEFVQLIVDSGRFIVQQHETSAQVAVRFLDPVGKLGLSSPILENVLTQPGGIITDDLFPVIENLDQIQRYMKEKMGMGALIDLEKFVDTRFAEAACGTGRSAALPSIIHGPELIVANMVRRQAIKERPRESVSEKKGFRGNL
ncbi:MAG: hypothetical protein B6245_04770 [Desulfobacteraceae bacterium 4572_88]|nr:MAG: hypothetical protein B6245_04770 [Desulfobacteraceae bacterium 4572_88]